MNDAFSGAGDDAERRRKSSNNAADTTTPAVSQNVWAYDGLGIRIALVEDVDGDNRLDVVLNRRGSTRALRLLSSQLTPDGWPPEAFSWFQPMPGINSGIFVG